MRVLEFGSFAQMRKHAAWLLEGIDATATSGVRAIANELLKDTRAKFGTGEHEGAGPYPTWEPLKQQTIERKERGGYAVPNDLVRTENLKDSFYVQASNMEAGVGSELEEALVHEVGDPAHNTPARSTLGLSFAEKEEKYHEMFDAYVEALVVQGTITRNYADMVKGK